LVELAARLIQRPLFLMVLARFGWNGCCKSINRKIQWLDYRPAQTSGHWSSSMSRKLRLSRRRKIVSSLPRMLRCGCLAGSINACVNLFFFWVSAVML
jgi:hypothetical protein